MKGYHRVKVFMFNISRSDYAYDLPEGWKPFSARKTGDLLVVVARKWERAL